MGKCWELLILIINIEKILGSLGYNSPELCCFYYILYLLF